MSMTEKLLHPFLGKKKHYHFWQKVYKLSLMGMNIGNGGGYEESGERYALQYVKAHLIKTDAPVLFDVGANIGGYANELLKYFPNAELHCFEPARKTYETLSNNVKATERVILNNFGASNEISESILYSTEDNSGLASLYNRQCFDTSRAETVKLDTLDHYCKERNISHIDFLKMDIEGNELNALHGAQGLLKARKIDAVQIEFGGCNIDSRTFFRDFWNLLHDNYKVYRVLLDGLCEVEEYGDILELFFCTNYLFISRDKG